MERCDFSSIMTIIRTYISEDQEMNQLDFIYMLFDSFISNEARIKDFDLDNGLVCRWINGQARVSPRISGHYLDKKNKKDLAVNLHRNLLPMIFDSAMATQKVYELIVLDNSISEKKKRELTKHYPCESTQDEADFIAEALCFGMSRDFVKRDPKTKNLLSTGKLSPNLSEFIFDGEVPKPCRYFCGREQELEQLHELLAEHEKVFLHGIAGIGKSELAKAYAKQHKKEYTNILYLTYSGDLKQDITDLDFVDDAPEDDDDERFRKHNRFMRSLKEDTLLIIDNFNVTATKDSFLSVIMKYHCRILFTTRSRLDNYVSMQLEEISDKEALITLVEHYYSDAEDTHSLVEQIIDTVHSHTLAVELAARLLENGILEPKELLNKLQEEKAALDASDKIRITKDGKAAKETYYGHIHTLFSLYQLSEEQQQIMRSMALIPITGIPARRLANWMNLTDMNTINDLIEMGFVRPLSGRVVALHPMMQEITIADMKPSVERCRELCDTLQDICLQHGADISYFKLLFQTIENVITLTDKDDLSYYLRFLEDVFPYMEKYQYESGMQLVLAELEKLLDEQSVGSVNDKALLLDYHAAIEPNKEKAIKYEKEALALVEEVTTDNAHLAANLQANLGGLYRTAGKIELARQHMETGIAILEQYNLIYMHDSVPQICNYAVLLTETGEAERGMSALRKLSRIIKDYNSDISADYAAVQEAMGGISLIQGKNSDATDYLKKAMKIYEIIWDSEPELIEDKYQEIGLMYPQAGIGLARELLSKTK